MNSRLSTLSSIAIETLAKRLSDVVSQSSALKTSFPLFLLLATLVSGKPDAAEGAEFWVSFDSDRSNPAPLDSREVRGDAYIFLLSENPLKEVKFFLDDQDLSGKAKSVDREAPYDLVANSASSAAALDTTKLSEGAHVVGAKLLLADGSTGFASTSFTVTNMQAADAIHTLSQPYMVFSRSLDRSGLVQPLANALVKGEIYPFMVSGKKVVRVLYSLDGEPYHTERDAPFDLKGGDVKKALPLDTTNYAEGPHTLRAKVDVAGGESTVFSIGFTIANISLSEPSGFISTSANFIAFGRQKVGTTSTSKTVTLTNTGFQAVDFEKIDINGDYDSSSNTCGSLEPGQNCSVSLSFSPIQFDSANGILSIVSNARNPQVIINLVGTTVRF